MAGQAVAEPSDSWITEDVKVGLRYVAEARDSVAKYRAKGAHRFEAIFQNGLTSMEALLTMAHAAAPAPTLTVEQALQPYLEQVALDNAAYDEDERQNALAVVREDPFTLSYVACMLQDLQITENNDAAQEEREPRDVGTVDSLRTELLADCAADCDGYRAQPGVTEALAGASRDYAYTATHAGSDFWLTRVGHGAGFWDRGLGAHGDVLTAACGHGTPYGNLDPVIGDDGLVYLE
jgi:hypothetical protein